MCEAAGHTVAVAHNGQVAIDALAREQFDLVLMDVLMPVMDGLTATKLIRQNLVFGRVPIIGLTALVGSPIRAQAADAGMNGILHKPFRNRQLLGVMEEVWSSNDAFAVVPKRPSDVAQRSRA